MLRLWHRLKPLVLRAPSQLCHGRAHLCSHTSGELYIIIPSWNVIRWRSLSNRLFLLFLTLVVLGLNTLFFPGLCRWPRTFLVPYRYKWVHGLCRCSLQPLLQQLHWRLLLLLPPGILPPWWYEELRRWAWHQEGCVFPGIWNGLMFQ